MPARLRRPWQAFGDVPAAGVAARAGAPPRSAGVGPGEEARFRVVVDSLTTDIKGALSAGYDIPFLTRGIHAEELGIQPGAAPDPERLAELCARHGEWPSAAIATFALVASGPRSRARRPLRRISASSPGRTE